MSHDETREDPIDETTETEGGASTYEKIMVAAREAKRLNDAVRDGAPLVRKPTTLAMKRVKEDSVEYRFREIGETPPPLEGNEFDDAGAE